MRTLASDLAAIRTSGGSTLSPAGVAQPAATHEDAHPVGGSNAHLLSSILGWLAVLLAVIAIAAGAYLGYGYLTTPRNLDEGPATSQPTNPTVTPPAEETGLGALPKTVPAHTSLLVRRPSHTGTFPLEAASGTLQTHFQLIREALNRIPASARTAELTPLDAGGKPLSFPGFATLIGAEDLITPDTFRNALSDDFTLLVLRGQGGFSAAYIFALKPDSAWLYAEPGVRIIEKSPNLESIFLQAPGTRVGEFSDETIGEQNVRTVSYENPVGNLIYGFFKNRLVIATSRQALDEALLLLCFEFGSC